MYTHLAQFKRPNMGCLEAAKEEDDARRVATATQQSAKS
jgi:hypothetical protein